VRRGWRRALLLLAAGGTVLAWTPFLLAATAGILAERHGCVLHEGYPNPCIIAGTDWGERLYGWGVMAWFVIVTWPVMLASLIGWPVYGVLRWWRRRT
jgi:hypothetical protein